MSMHEPNRMQGARMWAESLQELPPAAIASQLIDRAHADVEAINNEVGRQLIGGHVSFVLDPEAAEEHRAQKAEADITESYEALMACEADPDIKARDFRLEMLLGQEDEVDYFEQERRTEAKAARSRTQSLVLFGQIEKITASAEFGFSFGEGPEGCRWSSHRTIGAVQEVLDLQGELEMPVASDRLRALVVDGLDEKHDAAAAKLLLQIAAQTNDYETFITAAERFERAIKNQQNIEGLQDAVFNQAIRFIAEGKDVDRALKIALIAIDHTWPGGVAYPSRCAKLAVALQEIA